MWLQYVDFSASQYPKHAAITVIFYCWKGKPRRRQRSLVGLGDPVFLTLFSYQYVSVDCITLNHNSGH